MNFIFFAGTWVRVEHIVTVQFKKGYYLDEEDTAYVSLVNGQTMSAYGVTQEAFFASLGVPGVTV